MVDGGDWRRTKKGREKDSRGSEVGKGEEVR